MGATEQESDIKADNHCLDSESRSDHVENSTNSHDIGKDASPVLSTENVNWLKLWMRRSEDASAWFLLFRIFLYNAIIGFNIGLFPLLYVEYSVHFEASKAALGTISSLHMAAIAIGGLFVSWPLERFGAPKISFFGSLLSSLGLICGSFAESVTILALTQGLITGIGFAVTVLCAPVVLQRHFHRNRALANGLALLGLSVGSTISPMVTNVLLESYGWRGALLIVGGLTANMAAIGLTFHDPPSKKGTKDHIRHVSAEREEKSGTNSFIQAIRSTLDFSLLWNKSFALFCTGALLNTFFTHSYIIFTPSLAVHKGISLERAAFLSTTIFMSGGVTRIVFTFISNMNCANYLVLFALGLAIASGSVVVMLSVQGFTGVLLGSIMCGCNIGITNTILVVIMVELCGTDGLARALAILNLILASAAMLTAPICGWLFDITGSYDVSFIVSGCSAGLGCIIVIAVCCMTRTARTSDSQLPEQLSPPMESESSFANSQISIAL